MTYTSEDRKASSTPSRSIIIFAQTRINQHTPIGNNKKERKNRRKKVKESPRVGRSFTVRRRIRYQAVITRVTMQRPGPLDRATDACCASLIRRAIEIHAYVPPNFKARVGHTTEPWLV